MKMNSLKTALLMLTLISGVSAGTPQGNISQIKKETYVYRDTLKLDVYVDPTLKPEGKRPVFIHSFGGGWESGTRDINPDETYSAFNAMLRDSFVVVSIDYRRGVLIDREAGRIKDKSAFLLGTYEQWNREDVATSVKKAIRMAVEDLYDATAYLLKNADKWDINPDCILIGGGSAGATNSFNAAYLLCNDDELARKHLPEDFTFAGIIGGAGAIWVEGKGEPEWKQTPCPMLLFHGSNDGVVPYEYMYLDVVDGAFVGSKNIAAGLKAIKVPYWLYTGIEYDHVMSGTPFEENKDEIMSFIHRVIYNKEKIALETEETDYTGQRTLVRYLAKKSGMSEEDIVKQIEAMKQEEK